MKNVKHFSLICLMLLLCIAYSTNGAEAFGRGSSGPDVYAVQGMLKSLGYYAGTIDGKYGPLMEQGVRYFQQQYGLQRTGTVNDETLRSILWAYENAKIAPQKPPAPTPSPTPAKPPTSSQISAEEQQMIDLVNRERSQNGLRPLQIDLTIVQAARMKSQDMIDQNYFSHQSPTYGSPFEMMKKLGIEFQSAGENIACNQTVTAAHNALMNSQGHRENILSPNFTHIGIGIVNGGKCGKMFTQLFVGRASNG